jgi:hypothetical protein
MPHINCVHCLDKGWVIDSMLKSNVSYPRITLCHACKNVAAYSKEIKSRYGNQQETAQEKINRLTGRD